jgi:hypothetical protein
LARPIVGDGTGVGARGTISGPRAGLVAVWAANGRKLRKDPDVLAATLSDPEPPAANGLAVGLLVVVTRARFRLGIGGSSPSVPSS